MVMFRLARSYLLVRRVRSALTVCAIALSVSLVVAVTSGYTSMEGAALHYLNTYMGAADAYVATSDDQRNMPESLVSEIGKDPAVRRVIGRLSSFRELPRAPTATRPAERPDLVAAGAIPASRLGVELIGIRRPNDTRIDALHLIEGHWFSRADSDEAVVDQVVIAELGLRLGDRVTIPGLRPLALRIVGIIHKPTFFAQRSATIYLPLQTLQQFTGQDAPPQVSRIAIDLRGGADASAFQERWTARLAALDSNLVLHMRRDNSGTLERNLHVVHLLSYLGSSVAVVTALFIIFTALSMGVTERQRTLGMLRAVGATRGQIARLVMVEGCVLATVGITAGVPLGMFWVWALCRHFNELFTAGAIYSPGGICFAAGASLVGALAASALPAWQASRVSPLESMTAMAAPQASGPPIKWALLGIVLAAIDPLIFFGPVPALLAAFGAAHPDQMARTVRFFAHFAVGLPGVMIGYFLVAPLFVWVIERTLSPVVAALLGVPSRLLRQQLSSGIWRAAGTAAGLMVGLATLIVMQVQGHSLIGSWQLPDRFPDIYIWSPDVISWADQKQIAQIPGIAPGGLMPVVMTTPTGDSKTSLVLAAALSGQDMGIMFFAVDPAQAARMVQLEFRDNDGQPLPPQQQQSAEAAALAELQKGRHIIVTDEFRQARHLKIGDEFPIHTYLNGVQKYTICGIVWSPGADVLVSMFDLGRLMDQQTVGSVFGSIDDARRDFGVTGARLFAADLTGGIDKQALLRELQDRLGDRGLVAGDVRQIKYDIERAFYRLLAVASTVAIAAMALASLGVANTLMASVRSRRWQFGVLRSVGLVRGQLLRLVLAEALTLGAVGAALGLVAGLQMSVDGRQFGAVVLGYYPAMVFPWNVIGLGCLAVIVVAALASLWPALSVARAQPLDLLQAGRASA